MGSHGKHLFRNGPRDVGDFAGHLGVNFWGYLVVFPEPWCVNLGAMDCYLGSLKFQVQNNQHFHKNDVFFGFAYMNG